MRPLSIAAALLILAAAAERSPRVAIDEAHGNGGAASGVLAAFADLLTRGGYRVTPHRGQFELTSLATIDVLVVSAEPGVSAAVSGPGQSRVLSDRECDLIRDRVRGGGSLLIGAGRSSPSVDPGDRLAARFGVDAAGGWVFDRATGRITTALEFSRGNALLGDHAILRGRARNEQIARVRTAGGQSLGVPRGAAMLLKLSGTAREAMTRNDLEAEEFAARQEADIAGSFSVPVTGRAQAIALSFGKGRLVVLGDPDLLSTGLDRPDADNRQFVLNVMLWLSRQM